MPTTFIILSYPEWDKGPVGESWAKDKGYEYFWILHDKDYLDQELTNSEKPHYHCLVRTPNDMTDSAFCKNVGIEERWVRNHNNWKESVLYLLHLSKKSINDKRKYKYPYEALQGDENCLKKAKKYIESVTGNQQRKSGEDDKGILEIIDFIESVDSSISTAVLTRWCCSHNLYSVFRRSGRIVLDILAEHNNSCQSTVQETIYRIKIEQLEKRMTAQEKELERAYGDLWQRQINPFNGEVSFSTKGVDMDLLKEIQESA